MVPILGQRNADKSMRNLVSEKFSPTDFIYLESNSLLLFRTAVPNPFSTREDNFSMDAGEGGCGGRLRLQPGVEDPWFRM